MNSKFLAAALWVMPLASVPRTSLACSGEGCTPGSVLPSRGTVPENAVGWLVASPVVSEWARGDAGVSSPSVRIFIESTDSEPQELVLETRTPPEPGYNVRVHADSLLVPTQTLHAGTKLRVNHVDSCSGRNSVTQLEVTPSAEFPTELGVLETKVTSGTLEVWTDSASCTDHLAASYASVSVKLDARAEPFADVLRYVLLVDGKPYHGEPVMDGDDDERLYASLAGSALGAGTERVFALCAGSKDPFESWDLGALTEGNHELQMAALLPDGKAVLSDKAQIELRCPVCDSSADACATGTEPGERTGHGIDGGVAMPSAIDVDASVPPREPTFMNGAPLPYSSAFVSPVQSAAPPARATTEVTPEPEPESAPARRKSGCSVAAGNGLNSNGGSAALTLLGTVAFLRRKRVFQAR